MTAPRLAASCLGLGLVLGVWAAPSAARAGAAEDLAEAQRLLESVEDEKAVPLLLQALENPAATPAERADLWGLLGVARFNLRDEPGAREAFRKALDADPSRSVSKLLAPKGRALVEEVRAQREEELKAKAAAASAPPQVIVIVKPAEPLLGPREIAGLGVGAAGVVALAVGAGLAANATSLRGQAVAEPDAMRADGLFRSGKAQHGAGIGLLGAGAALAAAGVALFVWPEAKAAETPAGPAVVLAPNGVAVAGRF